MLAVFWPTWKLNEHLDKGDRRLLNIIGGVALIGILLMVTNPIFNPQKAFAYRGGMFLFSFVKIAISKAEISVKAVIVQKMIFFFLAYLTKRKITNGHTI